MGTTQATVEQLLAAGDFTHDDLRGVLAAVRTYFDVPVATEATSAPLWVTVIDHRHGTDASVHPTRESGFNAVVEYVREWWPMELDDEAMPTSPDEAVTTYFEHVHDEGYGITEADHGHVVDPALVGQHIYLEPEDRYVATLAVSYSPERDGTHSPEAALAAAVRLVTEDPSESDGTHWWVYDRATRSGRVIEQGEVADVEVR